jgi:hypothetical protein
MNICWRFSDVLIKWWHESWFLDSARFKAWVLGFDRVTGSPKSIFLNQNDVVLVKKKQKSIDCNRVFDRILPGQPGRQVNPSSQPGYTEFFIFLFFFNPVRFHLWINPLDYDMNTIILYKKIMLLLDISHHQLNHVTRINNLAFIFIKCLKIKLLKIGKIKPIFHACVYDIDFFFSFKILVSMSLFKH